MNEANRPLKVFLSYASQDRPLVRELSRQLVGEGWIDTWVDEKSLLPGQDWRVKIEEAVEEADVVIICLSNHSVSKEGYVQKELRYAREIALEKPEETIFLIPLRLDECEVPRGLRFYQWVDYFRDTKNNGYDALVKSLKLRYEQKIRLEEIENSRKEKARLEAEELVRQKAEKEKLEREVAEKAAREKLEKDAAEKARLELEKLDRQKAEKERLEHETAEKAARDKLEKEAAEKARLEAEELERQKTIKEQADREVAREKTEQDAIEKARLEVEELQRQKNLKEQADLEYTKKRLIVKPEIPKTLGTSNAAFGVVVVCVIILAIWLSSLNGTPTSPRPTSVPTSLPSVINSSRTPSPTFSETPTQPDIYTDNVGALSIEITDGKGVLMVYVPSGKFTMGENLDYPSNHAPAHQVYLDSYYIDKYEVTNGLYSACVNAGVCAPPKRINSYTRSNYYDDSKYVNYPVVYVDWNMANSYCEWRSAKLPTEAQWEKAALGIDRNSGVRYTCDTVNFYNTNPYKYCVGDSSEVGSFLSSPGPYNTYDMIGNVWEWVADWYSDTYYYDSPNANPKGPLVGESRVLRGGGWASSSSEAGGFYRGDGIPSQSKDTIGFRCARDVTP